MRVVFFDRKLFFTTNRSFILMTVLNEVNYVILIGISLYMNVKNKKKI